MASSLRSACRTLLLGSALSVALTGCYPHDAANSPKVEQKGRTAPALSKHRTFAVIYATADPMYGIVTETAEAEAKQLNASLIIKAPDDGSLEQQTRMIENMIKQRVDGIAISPVDSDALTPYINKAIEAGIPVVCFDMDAPGSKRLSYIGIDNYEAGRSMAAYVTELLKGQGMIVAESGMISFRNIEDRIRGFRDYLAQYTDMQLLELRTNGDHTDKAIANLESMIDAHPHFDAFIGFDSAAGSAAVTVWKAKGLYQYALTWNDMQELLEGIRYGQITASLSQHEELWGKELIAKLNDAADGKAIQGLYQAVPEMISKANAKKWRQAEKAFKS